VAYDGPVPRIVIDGVEAAGQLRQASVSGKRVVGVSAVVGPNSLIEVLASPDTRLRSIELYRLLAAVP